MHLVARYDEAFDIDAYIRFVLLVITVIGGSLSIVAYGYQEGKGRAEKQYQSFSVDDNSRIKLYHDSSEVVQGFVIKCSKEYCALLVDGKVQVHRLDDVGVLEWDVNFDDSE